MEFKSKDEEIVKPKLPYSIANFMKKLIGWLIAFELISLSFAEKLSNWLGLRNV